MRARLVLVPLVAAAALLAGCATKNDPVTAPTTAPAGNGVAALSADEILAKAKIALAAAKSFHVKGEMTDDEGVKAKIDMQFAGKNLKGMIESDGMDLELILIGGDLYMKAPDELWAGFLAPGQEAALALLKGKYVKLDATNAAFAGFADMAKSDEMLKPEGTITKGETKTINGVPAIGLVDGKDNSVMYIATEGEPLPLRQEGAAGDGALDFTEYGATLDIKAPAAADVFDLKTLMGG